MPLVVYFDCIDVRHFPPGRSLLLDFDDAPLPRQSRRQTESDDRPARPQEADDRRQQLALRKDWGSTRRGIDERDWDITNRIVDFVDKLEAIPWHNVTTGEKYLDSEGKEQPTPHFFDYWLWGLAAGSWHLPRKIPREWWEGFDDLDGRPMERGDLKSRRVNRSRQRNGSRRWFWVSGYVRGDGTVVRGHHRAGPLRVRRS